MPRQIKEIRNFNIGTITNADMREVSGEAASHSQGIDPNAPNGVLRANPLDKYKNGALANARYKVDTGITTVGSQNNQATSLNLSDVSGLFVGEFINISNYAFQITYIAESTNTVHFGATPSRFGVFTGDAVTIDAGTSVFKIPTPLHALSYTKDIENDIENVIIFDEEGSINGIEDLATNTADTLGAGINSTINSQDFVNFPLTLKHDNSISIVRKGLSFFIGSGTNNNSKWLGKVGNLALNSKEGYFIEDAALKSPSSGFNDSYDKVISFQFNTTNGSAGDDPTSESNLNNVSKVFFVAYKKNSSRLYIIDADNGYSNASIDLGFPICGLAKVVHNKTQARVWIYEKTESASTFATKPGKIHCYELFDYSATITLDSIASFPVGIPLSKKFTVDCKWGEDAATGYPSHPIYGRGIHSSNSDENPENVSPYISDILETVDSSGNGKLWLLASPEGNNQKQDWFQCSHVLGGNAMVLHRFIWCSFQEIPSNQTANLTLNFNCKSMPISVLRDHQGEVTSLSSSYLASNDSYMSTELGSENANSFKIRTMKRSVPTTGTSTYTPSANNDAIADFKYHDVAFNTTTGSANEERMFSLVHGGSFWYDSSAKQIGHKRTNHTTKFHFDLHDTELLRVRAGEDNTTFTGNDIQLELDTDQCREYDNFKIIGSSGTARTPAFKPQAHSLVDMSDLYDGVDHVVGCVVTMSNQHESTFLEDMWVTNVKDSSGNPTLTKGLRLVGMKGKSLLWITNGHRNNYGALYVRSNAFGYDKSDSNADETDFDEINLSTLCFDKGDDVVRQIKVLGNQIPQEGITSIARNNHLTAFNGTRKTNDRDFRFSGLFVSFKNQGMVSGLAVRLNTTVEQADTIANITSDGAAVSAIIGDTESGLAGFATARDDASLDNTVHDNAGATDSIQQHPANELAIAQTNYPSGTQSITNTTSATQVDLAVETLNPKGGLVAGTAEDPANVFPDGPHVISYFDTNNFFRKVHAHGQNGGNTLEKIWTDGNVQHTVGDNVPVFLRSDSFHRDYQIDSGPYEGVAASSADFHNGTISKFGFILSTVDDDSFNNAGIVHVWPQGKPDNEAGSGASASTRYSAYNLHDYYFTRFDRDKNTFSYNSLGSVISSDLTVQNLGDHVANQDSIYKFELVSVYQNNVYKMVSFADGDAYVESTDGSTPNYPNSATKKYKIAFEYDGYQDSPLATSTHLYTASNARTTVNITLRVDKSINPRISAIHVFRKGLQTSNVLPEEPYYHVKRVPLLRSEGWLEKQDNTGVYYEIDIVDAMNNNGTYEDYTGMKEFIIDSSLNYKISTSANNKLYVAGFSHPFIPGGNNSICCSKPGKYAQFDVINDRIDIEDDITALAYFNNLLYAFSKHNTYKIDVNANTVLDVVEGIGCINKDSVIVTDFGMYFADANHVYHHDGAKVNVISYPIDTDTGDASAKSYREDFNGKTRLYFSTKFNMLIVINTSDGVTSNLFTYHVLKQRWDYRRIETKDGSNAFNTHSIVNNLMIPSKVDGTLYAITDAEGKGADNTDQACKFVEVNKGATFGRFLWESKTFSMGSDNVNKKFLKIKIEASGALTTNPTIEVDGSTTTSTALGNNEFKIKAKGKSIKINFGIGNEGIEVFSIGIIYRQLKIS